MAILILAWNLVLLTWCKKMKIPMLYKPTMVRHTCYMQCCVAMYAECCQCAAQLAVFMYWLSFLGFGSAAWIIVHDFQIDDTAVQALIIITAFLDYAIAFLVAAWGCCMYSQYTDEHSVNVCANPFEATARLTFALLHAVCLFCACLVRDIDEEPPVEHFIVAQIVRLGVTMIIVWWLAVRSAAEQCGKK